VYVRLQEKPRKDTKELWRKLRKASGGTSGGLLRLGRRLGEKEGKFSPWEELSGSLFMTLCSASHFSLLGTCKRSTQQHS
jgi:hypothetical protein